MNILYLDIDACRPDHLGCYGYHRNTSPQIDAIARDGVRFDQCYASDAPCLPSRTAFYSGRFGIQTGVVGHGGTAAQPKVQGAGRGFSDWFVEQGLAGRLQQQGYHTAMISPFGQRHAAHWFYAGFNEIHNTGGEGMESAEQVWPATASWLRQAAARQRWFLHINFWDPHTPYRAPAAFGDPFKDEPLPAWLEDPAVLVRHQKLTGPHTALDIGMYDGTPFEGHDNYPRHPWSLTDASRLRAMIDGYDTAIRYVDEQIGRIVQFLRDNGLYDDTAIIISADHGENQGELGIYGEHGTADAATCRVPLIIKWPGGQRNVVRRKFHYNVDVAPTLMELFDAKPSPLWDGSSFAPAIMGPAEAGRDELVISQCAHVCQRSVRWDRWLYVRTYHDGFHLFPTEMLFDLENDPHEQHNLAAAQPAVCREAAWRLTRWHDAQMQKMSRHSSDVVDPLWTVMREGGPFHARVSTPGHPIGGIQGLRRYLERLESTGRAEGAAALRHRYAEALCAV